VTDDGGEFDGLGAGAEDEEDAGHWVANGWLAVALVGTPEGAENGETTESTENTERKNRTTEGTEGTERK
jgi:hypothetical protein